MTIINSRGITITTIRAMRRAAHHSTPSMRLVERFKAGDAIGASLTSVNDRLHVKFLVTRNNKF